MQEMGVFWLRVAVALYFIGLLHAVFVILRKGDHWFRFALLSFGIGAVLHIVSVVELTVSIGHLPVDNTYETISLCALLIALSFLFVYWRYSFATLSVFIFPLVFVMSQIGAMERPVAAWPNLRLRDAWLLLHVLSVLVGYAALLLTAVASFFYLIQERQLKRKTPSTFFDHLPALATLDDLITNAMSFGFVFITLGVIAGTAWAFVEKGTAWIGDPKIAFALLTWVAYLLMVFLRASAGWRGRKAAFMAIGVLAFSALTWVTHDGLRSWIVR